MAGNYYNNRSANRNNNSYNSKIVSEQEIKERFTCGICQNILENPYRPSVCQHVFCKDCLYNSFINKKACPLCRKPYEFAKTQHERMLDIEISSSKTICEKCDQKLFIKDLNTHNLVCIDSSISRKPQQSVLNNQSSAYNMSSMKTEMSRISSSSSVTSFSSSSSSRSVSNRYTFKCPYCPQNNLTISGLRGHCNELHVNGEKNKVCPICASMPWGDSTLESIDFIGHLNLRHRFEYDSFVDYNQDEDSLLEVILQQSLKIR